MIYKVACLFCEVVWVSTMPRGKKTSCRDDGGGHKPLNSVAAKMLRVSCNPLGEGSMILLELLAAEPAFAFAGTRNQSVAVRSGGYEPPFCQYGGWTVAAVPKTNNFLCPKTRPCIRTQKRPNFPQGVNSSVSNVDLFRLTLAAPAYSLCTAIHNERKSRAFLICNLVFGDFGSPQIVCGAANLQRGVKCIHNLQSAYITK